MEKWFFAFLMMLFAEGSAQSISNLSTVRNINSERYFRFSYDNDFFSATDRYYTQGIDAEIVLPKLKNTLLANILPRTNYTGNRYGFGVQHNGYTPSSISSDNILYNDHPFAAVLMMKAFVIQNDSERHQRFSSSVFAGIIGPAAGGGEMQLFIHRALANITPHGWQHQIRNSVVVNYQAYYERELLASDKYFMMSAMGVANLGTLNTSAGVGTNIMIGYFTSPFAINSVESNNDISAYVYASPTVNFIGYAGQLQGGLFNNSSPYVVSAAAVERVVMDARIGIVCTYRGIHLEYFGSWGTRTFNAAKPQKYGGVQIAFNF